MAYTKKRAMRPRSRAKTLRRKPKRLGLNKVEKKQVSAIVNKKAETKYFNPEFSLHGQQLKYQSSTSGNQEIMVRGFTVGPGGAAIQNETYGYESTGGAARTITPIHMVRTFDASLTGDPAESYSANVPDGKYVNPSFCQATWRLFREKIDTSDATEERLAAPYYVRFIHVRPRQSKYSDTTLVPRLDLFMNNYGVAYGIESPANNYQKNFGLFEMQTAKVNSRKYVVVKDSHCMLYAPNITTQIDTDLLTSVIGASSQKIFKTDVKQPAKLYYDGVYNTDVTREPLAGQANDMIFIHVGVLGTSQKSLPISMKIDVKPVSTFKDI